MLEVNSAASLQCHLSLPLLLVALRWKLEAGSAPLKLIKQLSFSTNFRPVDHGRRMHQRKENARFRPYANFPRGKRRTRLCSNSNPRVQNFPPTRRDVINSGLMITQKSRFCMK